MSKQVIDSISVYITNVCGLSCSECATFNNYILKGHYYWSNSKDRITKWAELAEIREINIIGGEPFLNPDLDNWVIGLRKTFPNCPDIRILTGLTGQSLIRHKDAIRKYLDYNVCVQISVHSPSNWEQSKDTAKKIIEGFEYKELDIVENATTWPMKNARYIDAAGKSLFLLLEQWNFFPNAQKEIKDNIIYFHRSDPIKAHTECLCKDSHYMVDGFLYKCHISGVADMLVKQLPIDPYSKELLGKVKGLDPYDNPTVDFREPLLQCTLCSDVNLSKNLIPIYPLNPKKPKLHV